MTYFYMITTTYNSIHSTKLNETIYCINYNLQNDLIKKYFILLEINLTKENQYLYNNFITPVL